MAIRSNTSQYQLSPPNYRLASTGAFRNVGRYRNVLTSSAPVGPNMCTAPVPGTSHLQFQYIPRVSG